MRRVNQDEKDRGKNAREGETPEHKRDDWFQNYEECNDWQAHEEP
jgi:hypothetical protein